MATTRTALTSEENEIFEGEWDPFLTRHFRSRDVIDVFEDNKAEIKEAIEIAKYELEASFGGVNARTNEFGWMPIMPNFLLAAEAPTYETATWNKYVSTANVSSRWIDYVGTDAASVKVSKYASLILLGFTDPTPEPKVAGILAEIKAVKYPIWSFGDAFSETDYHVFELPRPIIIETEQDMYLQKLCVSAGLDKLQPLGIYFATGDHMRDKNAYAKT